MMVLLRTTASPMFIRLSAGSSGSL